MINIETQIAKLIEANGAFLYDIEIVKEFDETIYRILIIKQGGVSLDLCAVISRELSPFLDVNPPMHDRYRLEVSSSGIERKLIKPLHFQNSIGDKIKFKVLGEDKGKGVLKEANNTSIIIETKDGDKTFNYEDLGTVKTYFDWN
jgi:ribosome maturation factor RimP